MPVRDVKSKGRFVPDRHGPVDSALDALVRAERHGNRLLVSILASPIMFAALALVSTVFSRGSSAELQPGYDPLVGMVILVTCLIAFVYMGWSFLRAKAAIRESELARLNFVIMRTALAETLAGSEKDAIVRPSEG